MHCPLFQTKMLQASSILGHERPLVIRVSFSTFVVCTVCLPLLGLITCIFISSVLHYEDSTGTHCRVIFLFCKMPQPCFSWNAHVVLNHVFPGPQLPAIYQCLNKPEPWVPHMAVLYRTALGSEAPGGVYLLQILQDTFYLEVPGEFIQLLQPGLFCLWKPWPLAPHICVIKWNILWVIHGYYWRGFIQTSAFPLSYILG